ncbi:hypothetical protein [Pectobacterium parmentieri]|uniref:hypothetical protein n=1 Tax=Pectobacterium parmentieri TaxID=1905730 RepID=UPI000CDD6FA6|nr:hypothetical protein [Pectobacterium parmentieri]AYH04138.1 hypothetical protein C5E25_01325 [Pectobacterium parmentieri]AYH12959.1 hypothetical protein C5E23_01310 [Pectobacterium parmentieri]AYH21661.1 hypothetical protein C5E21_01305 [Pectobacterium parmentieri]MBN3177145.1 hypothetical protein [Pectobacterium parmentieri]POW25020.1 hypothetical protein PB20LOC_03560 [Pectobacterium parmentieri]
MNGQHLEVVTCVEHANVMNKQARAVLSMWLDSLSNEAQDEEEANLVAAVLSLVAGAINHLDKAMEVRNAPASTK